MDSIYSSLESP